MSDIDFKNKKAYVDFKKSNAKVSSDYNGMLLEKKKKKKYIIVLIVIAVLIALIVYTAIDIGRKNSIITVQNVTITHEQLPESFFGYKILQISDLNGKEFGDRQEKLLEVINGLDYDIILLTGDYVANDGSGDAWALWDILDGLEKTTPIYYIFGEQDEPFKDALTEQFEERGLIPVYPAQRIESAAGEYIYLSGIKNNSALEDFDFEAESDFYICVAHEPIDYNVDTRLANVNTRIITEIDYDVSISGHTLGGQYRLPILGTVYSEGQGAFPQERYIYGMHTDDSGRVNYISGGLGVKSGFRMGITPEIALIELKSEE